MYDRLGEIKNQHEVLKKKDFFGVTIHPRDTDWLIEQAEKAEQYKQMLEEIVAFTKYDGNQWYSDAKKLLDK